MKFIKFLVFSLMFFIPFFILGCSNSNINDDNKAPEAPTYSITYNLDGGLLYESNINNFNSLDDLYNLKSPYKANNSFAGWYLDSDFNISLDSLSKTPTNNITLYAKWEWYDIFTPTDFMNIKLNCNYRINNDLDMSSIINYKPIGNYDTPFVGTIEGNNHIISNLTINHDNDGYVGIFGCIKDSTIQNLRLKSINVLTSTFYIDHTYAGTLVGKSSSSSLQEISITNLNVNISSSDYASVGGLIGHSFRDNIYKCRITKNELENTVSYTSSSSSCEIGGFVGENYSTINVCYSMVSVLASCSKPPRFGYVYVGAFAGINHSGGIINQVYSYGSAESTLGESLEGGLIGLNTGVVSNFFIHETGSCNGAFDTQNGVVSNGYRIGNATYPHTTNITNINNIFDSTFMKNTVKFTDSSWYFENGYYPEIR